VVEKTLQHKLTLGFPKDEMSVLPDTDAPIIALWLRIQNTSRSTMNVDVTRFSYVDETGKTYSALPPQEAVNQIVAGMSRGSIATKALRGISLGKVGDAPPEEVVKNHVLLYSLQSGEIQSRVVKEGIVYFPRPPQKKFTINVTLGDLWSQPLTFSTEKQ